MCISSSFSCPPHCVMLVHGSLQSICQACQGPGCFTWMASCRCVHCDWLLLFIGDSHYSSDILLRRMVVYRCVCIAVSCLGFSVCVWCVHALSISVGELSYGFTALVGEACQGLGVCHSHSELDYWLCFGSLASLATDRSSIFAFFSLCLFLCLPLSLPLTPMYDLSFCFSIVL